MVLNGILVMIVHGSEWDISHDCLWFRMGCQPGLFMVLNGMSAMIIYGSK
jgi:hypothetical protein